MDSNSIKENIRRIREESGLSQLELASRMNISRTAYRQIEAGQTQLISKHLETISEITGRELEELLLGFVPLSKEELIAREQNPDNEYIKARFRDLEDRIDALQEELKIKNESIRTLTDINNRLINQIGGNR